MGMRAENGKIRDNAENEIRLAVITQSALSYSSNYTRRTMVSKNRGTT